jgi:hypothetical protein
MTQLRLERLVVLAIVGILLAFAVPACWGVAAKANDTVGSANAHNAYVTSAADGSLAP